MASSTTTLTPQGGSSWWGWPQSFIVLQILLQILLLFPQFVGLRVPIRILAFAASPALLLILNRQHTYRWAAHRYGVWVIWITLLSLLHPSTQLLSGLAQCALYISVLAPLFWTSQRSLNQAGWQTILLLLWGFYTISSIFGVLQVLFPGQYQPALSAIIQNLPTRDGLMITLANGAQVFRPMGLTDVPGGAASSGYYAILFSMGMILTRSSLWLRALAVNSIAMGFFCIYLSHVRLNLVLAIICLVALAVVFLRQGKSVSVFGLLLGMTAIAVVTLNWALQIGGEGTTQRLASLVADSPLEVYQKNRGGFLWATADLLLDYPLGAGLGRWGMMSGYFGQFNDANIPSLWAEIQWTGWLYDGGLPLMVVYTIAIVTTCRLAWNVAMSSQLGELSLWGGVIFAYNIGALATTFSYPLFVSQAGMEFWLLNGALFAVIANQFPQYLPDCCSFEREFDRRP